MSIRTDLALEAHEIYTKNAEKTSEINGVIARTISDGGVKITKIEITNKNGAEALKKPQGNYITIEAPDIISDNEEYERACIHIAKNLSELLGEIENKSVLVVGLGNNEITPDALGPCVLSRLIVTRHMKNHMPHIFDENFSNVCAIAPGVLGTTGIESVDVIKAVAREVDAKVIIAVDALASRSPERISTTIQISDTGIQPGAGVGNRREGLNEENLGIKVIAIGVPTVIDAKTIARDSLDLAFEKTKKLSEEEKEKIISDVLFENKNKLIVTPKDIDMVIERAAKTLAKGINMSLHRGLSGEEIESFVG